MRYFIKGVEITDVVVGAVKVHDEFGRSTITMELSVPSDQLSQYFETNDEGYVCSEEIHIGDIPSDEFIALMVGLKLKRGERG